MSSIGVLALQGDFAAHAQMLRRVGAPAVAVRHPAELSGLAGLVIPGGESTTLLKLMRAAPWFLHLAQFYEAGGAIFGTCAGAILLSAEVQRPTQPSLGLLAATIERNAYGRQLESFEAQVEVPLLGQPVEAVFIRAPRFQRLGRAVEVLARYEDQPVLVRQGRLLAATFHPELTGDDRLHRWFVAELARRHAAVVTPRASPPL